MRDRVPSPCSVRNSNNTGNLRPRRDSAQDLNLDFFVQSSQPIPRFATEHRIIGWLSRGHYAASLQCPRELFALDEDKLTVARTDIFGSMRLRNGDRLRPSRLVGNVSRFAVWHMNANDTVGERIDD